MVYFGSKEDFSIFRKPYQKHKTSSRITICNSAMTTLAIIKESGHRKAETAAAKRNLPIMVPREQLYKVTITTKYPLPFLSASQ